ncbi:hypothetical protein LK09_02140 [Microbacterium mangrovi]|uniref:Glycosyltransferase RgtA/B/C/D-like domain-containing protein n=1 Tax=Microbacterium mangrovi TaxID=1348253 RepID=A0A0B2A7I6_9MICO|nr:hypothetical protein [Microbacterium mangrovi]KHK99469.1 hypothetical protein LK09_02140 [Microbacterium mangrovi]
MRNGARDIRWWILYGSIAAVAFGARLLMVLRGGGLLGVGGYDDGVYYAASAALVHGRLPYRDFLFIQPPGVVVAGAPFAWFGSLTSDSLGFAAAHLGFMLVGAISAALVAVILRRFGFIAAAAGGLAYAVSYVAMYAERSILLEPFGTLGILLALVVLSRPRLRAQPGWLIAAGVALGMTCGFKIWYIVPAVIIIAWSGRGWWRMLLGAVIGGCLIYLPFFLADPAAAVGEIVLDQLGRSGASPSLGSRVHMIVGDYPAPTALAHLGVNKYTVTIVSALVALAAVVIAATVRRARLYVVLFVADAVVLLTAPSFFLHYTALTAPMLALVFGVAVGRVAELIRVPGARFAFAGGVAVLLVALNAPTVLHGTGREVPAPRLTAEVQAVDGCVIADDPTLLAVTDVLSRDLRAGCPLWPDVTGYTYGPAQELRANGQIVPRVSNAKWQRTVVRYLTSGSAVILGRPDTGLSKASYRIVTDGEVLHSPDGVVVVVRTVGHSG